MKNLLITVFFLSLTLQLSAETGGSNAVIVEKTTASPAEKTPVYWQKMADGMSQALIKHFWGANFKGYENRFYFNYGSDLSNMTTNHYWPQAHAMDVMVDAYMRTGSKQYLNIYPLWWEGAPKFNFAGREEDPWWNVFVDDMEWIALAQIRMFESTKNTKYLKRRDRPTMIGFGLLGDRKMRLRGLVALPGRRMWQNLRTLVPMVLLPLLLPGCIIFMMLWAKRPENPNRLI